MRVEETLSIVCASSATHPAEERLRQSIGDSDGFVVVRSDSCGEALASLSEGAADLAAVPADEVHSDLESLRHLDLEVVGALRRKHPFHVLVSDDRIDYLPKGAIVLADEAIVRRQMRRRRAGLVLRSHRAFATSEDLDLPDDDLERFRWAEALRSSGAIDGHIAPRPLFESAGARARRHALQIDPEDRGIPRFTPVPFTDLCVIVARRGFPRRMLRGISDPESESAWMVHERVLAETPDNLHNRLGLLIRHRQISTLLNEAERLGDLFIIDSEINPEGEVVADDTRVEIVVEILSRNGRRTVCVERVVPVGDLHSILPFLCIDWNTYLERSQEPHDESIRDGPARPPFLDP